MLIKHRRDCTLVDQEALCGPDYQSIAFCIKAHPVVLLAGKPDPRLLEWVAEIVDPSLGAAAIGEAVENAIPTAA
jgi:hypothetical protein